MKYICLVFLLFFSSINIIYCQEKSYLDFINEITPIYPGCEYSVDKSECYKFKIGDLIKREINKKENLLLLSNYKGVLEINLALRNEIDGNTTIISIKNVEKKIENIVIKSLENLPLIQPVVNFREGQSKSSSISFYIVLEKKANSKNFELVNRKSKDNLSKMPSPNPDKIKNILLKDCVDDDLNNDCFYIKIKDFILNNIEQQVAEKIKGEKFILIVKFDNKGNFLKQNFECSLAKYEDYFVKILDNLIVLKPAQLNGKNIEITYSIPVQIL